MADCIQCKWLVDGKCAGPELRQHKSLPIRKCINAYLMECLERVKCRSTLLEIGVGANRNLRCFCGERGIDWYGIDPRWEVDQIKHRYSCKANEMHFSDRYFQYVFCSQTMEHWGKDCPIESGLKEIHRVTIENGLLFVDVPMQYHGGKLFLDGDKDGILAKFDPALWQIVRADERRKNYAPLEPWYEKKVRSNPPEGTPSAWILTIEAVRI